MPSHPRPSPDSKVNVLLIGGGGREHALAWRLRQSPSLGTLYITHPENPGLAALGTPIGVPFLPADHYRLPMECASKRIGLVVIGPEGPLAEGLGDKLTSPGTVVFGPTRDAAQLESDKAWAKDLMRSASIPTAEARVFSDPAGAVRYLRSRDTSHVVKAAGLASGKGVVVAETLDEAIDAVNRIMVKREFGAAGDRVVIEERLSGREVSVFALVDGRNVAVLDACQDHKRLNEGDEGPNTGGMGAICPSSLIDQGTMADIQRNILVPTVDAMRREGIEFRGVLYAGLMLTPGGPRVLEFNVRFGDPECQCLVRRMNGDWVKLLHATASGRLHEAEDELGVDPDAAHVCCIVLASRGYPSSPVRGDAISGLADAEKCPGVTLFHAGTASDKSGELVTAGGRVLDVTAVGATPEQARSRALAACELVRFEGMQYRRDIGIVQPAARRPVPAGAASRR